MPLSINWTLVSWVLAVLLLDASTIFCRNPWCIANTSHSIASQRSAAQPRSVVWMQYAGPTGRGVGVRFPVTVSLAFRLGLHRRMFRGSRRAVMDDGQVVKSATATKQQRSGWAVASVDGNFLKNRGLESLIKRRRRQSTWEGQMHGDEATNERLRPRLQNQSWAAKFQPLCRIQILMNTRSLVLDFFASSSPDGFAHLSRTPPPSHASTWDLSSNPVCSRRTIDLGRTCNSHCLAATDTYTHAEGNTYTPCAYTSTPSYLAPWVRLDDEKEEAVELTVCLGIVAAHNSRQQHNLTLPAISSYACTHYQCLA
ncbi:hypothetical protein CTAM01_08767 [Colletotrichum tamarilloi]|uniref:Membrane-associated protein n=1 Tax=Colletotrichum tamarilloi TaxID=1209934 RepID=A0ABQ9R4W5_9PEZI|nr:uncharacterized protein CTAM01_08767 [Colletotrichum tamarilloi]KAK1494754.1 hypothetical protein CTAM01_08767 [Colletotrichum tamarilloi]